MAPRHSTRSEGKKPFIPPVCRVCPWHELPEDTAGDCLNFKKLLCRLQPAAVLERYFSFQGL
jgi:hypothetical protein